MSKTINAARLRALGACSAQVEMFVSLFGEKDMEPTLVLCVEHAATFDWDWARCLLSATARRAYNEATATARRACSEATATARRACSEARAQAWFAAWQNS